MKQKWKKTKSGILVPSPLWFVRVLLSADNYSDEPMYWYYLENNLESFSRSVEHAVSFTTRKQADDMAFQLTLKYPQKIGEIEVISKMPNELFIEDKP